MTTIWFDMDGTLNKFYEVPNWLPKLRAYDPSPYAEAKVMHNMSLLARYLNKVQANGYHIGIISWLSQESTAEYDKLVTEQNVNGLNYIFLRCILILFTSPVMESLNTVLWIMIPTFCLMIIRLSENNGQANRMSRAKFCKS